MSTAKEFVRQVRIARYKRLARESLLCYRGEVSRYDCGTSLAAHVNPRVHRIAQRFDRIMVLLSAVDPNCPPWTRLSDATPTNAALDARSEKP